MKISFVIPVYNAELYISRCVDSLLAQDIQDYEIICINDGSTDNSLAILKEYENKFPDKFIIISQENSGIAYARNNAFKYVKGDYTWFIDNDDCIHPNCLGKILDILEKNRIDILNIEYIKDSYQNNPFENTFDELVKAEKVSQEKAMYFYFDAPWSKIYRTDFLRKNKLFFPDVYGEDTTATFDLYSKTDKIYMLNKPLYAWYYRANSFSNSNLSKKHFETFPEMLKILKCQSEKCPAHLKMYYDYLILRKADVYIPHIKRCDVSEDLKSLKIKCIQETQKIIDQLYDNLFWNIHIKELETISNAEEKIRLYYEKSLSWRITKPMREFMKIIRKMK